MEEGGRERTTICKKQLMKVPEKVIVAGVRESARRMWCIDTPCAQTEEVYSVATQLCNAASIHHLQEIQELQAQVGDLMFYLDTQSKVASTADGVKQVSTCLVDVSPCVGTKFMLRHKLQDIQEGHVVVTQSAPTSRKPKKRHRWRKQWSSMQNRVVVSHCPSTNDLLIIKDHKHPCTRGISDGMIRMIGIHQFSRLN